LIFRYLSFSHSIINSAFRRNVRLRVPEINYVGYSNFPFHFDITVIGLSLESLVITSYTINIGDCKQQTAWANPSGNHETVKNTNMTEDDGRLDSGLTQNKGYDCGQKWLFCCSCIKSIPCSSYLLFLHHKIKNCL
jgi:hypothetical protein